MKGIRKKEDIREEMCEAKMTLAEKVLLVLPSIFTGIALAIIILFISLLLM